MNINEYNNPKNSLVLFELSKKFDFLIRAYNSEKFPKVLMLSGEKGIGKFTLINHFLSYVYDKNNYDLESHTINNQTLFYKQYLKDLFPNIMYLSGNNFKSSKIEDIRNLKVTINKTSLSKNERFIILDDIELFNTNSLNALLKIIEEPNLNDYFVLINNKTRALVDTIYSRSFETKVFLPNDTKIRIINALIKRFNLKIFIDPKSTNLTPGNFLIFNDICGEHKIDYDDNFLNNLEILINLFKKNKDINLINMILSLTEYYFSSLQRKKIHNFESIIKNKNFIINNVNNFFKYNLNHNSLINAINDKLSNG